MKTIVVHLLKEWGIKAVLNELISLLKKTNDLSLVELSEDLQASLKRYENREKKAAKIGA